MAKTKAQLTTENNSNFPNNNSQFITPEKLRGFNQDMIDSVALSLDTQMTGTGSFGSLSGSGYVSASEFIGDGSKLTGVISSVPAGTVSGSSQIILTQTTGNLGGNRITGSVQSSVSSSHSEVADEVPYIGISGKPTLVSGSSQIDLGLAFGTASQAVSSSHAESAKFATDALDAVTAQAAISSSYAITASFALNASGADTGSLLVTASNDFSQITFTKGDSSTFQLDVTPRRVVETVKNKNGFMSKGTPVYVSGSTGNELHVYQADAGLSTRVPATFILDQDLDTDESGIGILSGFINGVNTSLFAEGANIYLAVGGGYTDVQPTGSAFIQKLGNVVKSELNGSGVISGAGRVNALPNIAQDKVWVGDSNGVPQEISKNNLGLALTGSNNTFSGNQTFNDITVQGTGSFAYIQSVTGSAKIIGDAFIILNNDTPTERYAGIVVQDSGSGSPLTTASLEFDGQSNDWFYGYSDDGGVTADHGVVLFGPEYNTKGSPTYPSSNVIQKGTGGHHLTGSNISDNGTTVSINSNTEVTGSLRASGNIYGNDIILDDPGANSTILLNPNFGPEFIGANLQWREGDNQMNFTMAEESVEFLLNGWAGAYDNGFYINSNADGATFSDWELPSYNKTPWLNVPQQGEPNFYRTINVTDSDNGFNSVSAGKLFQTKNNNIGGIGISSNLNSAGVSGHFGPGIYGFLDDSNYYEVIKFQDSGSYTDGTITVSTPIIIDNNATITGGLVTSGSIKSEVKSASIISQTASIDFNDTSMFELTLGSGVDTRIEGFNVGTGQTVNLLITQDASTAGTVTFSSQFLQPTGSEYTPTTTLGGQDILTLVTFSDTNKIYVANVKELV